MRIYENMLQNTLQLPDHEWGEVEADFARLRALVEEGEGIAFTMSGLDEALRQRFASFGELAAGTADPRSTYETWSNTNRATIASSLRAAGLTSEQFRSEQATMSHLRLMSETSVGQMQALQVAHQIAAQQVEQTQKLRGLVSQQIALMGTWYQSEQAQRDLAQQRRDKFFAPISITSRSYQQMEPRW
jgi:P-type conjugative transfer protein TrbJ